MNLAIIPARGGSKRIPKKNIKSFFGKPIIAWSIEAAKEAHLFDRIIVSTDDRDIAKVALECGAEVPFLRPKDLSDDFTPTIPVVAHAINEIKSEVGNIRSVCCLYATAPFIKPSLIIEGHQLLQMHPNGYVFTATDYPFPIQRAIQFDDNGELKMIQPDNFNVRSQDLSLAFHDAGQFYWADSSTWLAQKPFFNKHSTPLLLPRRIVQDIDTEEDWEMAELLYRVNYEFELKKEETK